MSMRMFYILSFVHYRYKYKTLFFKREYLFKPPLQVIKEAHY